MRNGIQTLRSIKESAGSVHLIWMAALILAIPVGCSQEGATSTAENAPEEGEKQTAQVDQQQEVVLDTAAAMKKIETYFTQGQYQSAFPLLDQLHKAKACPPEGYAIRAQILDHSGLTNQAISSMTLALAKKPDQPEWHNMLGLLYVKVQNLPLARQAFTKAIELKPDHSKAYNNRGLMFIAMGDYESAIQDFNVATTQDDQYVDAYNNRGYAHLQMGQFDKSIENFTRCVQIDPEYVKGYNNRGFALMKLGSPEQAVEDFTAAIKRAPYEVKHYLHRRDAYQTTGNFELANKDQQMAQWVQNILVMTKQLQRDPENVELFVQRAKLFVKGMKFEDARKDLARAKELDATFAPTLICEATILLVEKKFQEAVDVCTKALEFGENFEANSIRGDAYMGLGQLDQAITDYQAAQRFDNMVALAYWKRAEANKEGNPESAEQDRKTALQLDPNLKNQVK